MKFKKLLPSAVLVFLSLALCWTVLQKAGVYPADWTATLLALGCIALLYVLSTNHRSRAPGIGKWASILITAVPCYLALQLLPLPLSVLRIISPARESLALATAAIVPNFCRAPLSVNAPAAVLLFFSMIGYIVTFFLVREIAWQCRASFWIPVLPLLLIAALESVIGLVQSEIGRSDGVAKGTYTSRDHFCGLLEMILPLSVVCGLAMLRRHNNQRGPSTRFALAACAAWSLSILIFVAILYSLSRAGFLAALAGLFFVVVYCLPPRYRARTFRFSSVGVLMLLTIGVFLFFSPGPLMERFAQMFLLGRIVAEGRPSIWTGTLSLISEFPWFGCGLGGFESAFLKHQTTDHQFTVQFAHNDYLQYLAELGFVGFSILAAAIISVLVPIFRGLKGSMIESRRLVTVGCVGGITAIALHSMVDFNMYIPANAMTLAWIAGVASNSSKTDFYDDLSADS
jgi:O-antigen ligase